MGSPGPGGASGAARAPRGSRGSSLIPSPSRSPGAGHRMRAHPGSRIWSPRGGLIPGSQRGGPVLIPAWEPVALRRPRPVAGHPKEAPSSFLGLVIPRRPRAPEPVISECLITLRGLKGGSSGPFRAGHPRKPNPWGPVTPKTFRPGEPVAPRWSQCPGWGGCMGKVGRLVRTWKSGCIWGGGRSGQTPLSQMEKGVSRCAVSPGLVTKFEK